LVAAFASLTTMALAAFTAATLLPGGSEAVFLALLAAGAAEPWILFTVAALANTAGGMTSWWIGTQIARGADSESGHRWMRRFRLPPESFARATRLFTRYGWATLLLCWMPVIGDPITLVAGMARYPALPTALITAAARTARYAIIWAAATGLIAWWG
jgi:membrane protein YqaA with SNARE-associated domain